MLVLHVDDDPVVRELIKIGMGRYGGHEIISFADANSALEYLRQSDVDLIISDVMMPKLDGAHFIKAVRGEGLSRAPVVFLTSGYDFTSASLEELHPLAILSKPFDPLALPNEIQGRMTVAV